MLKLKSFYVHMLKFFDFFTFERFHGTVGANVPDPLPCYFILACENVAPDPVYSGFWVAGSNEF
jgi:hypothetical protein